MKIYAGERVAAGAAVEASVTVNGRSLEPRLELLACSAVGFEWGGADPGSTQLALAILADCLGDEAALEYHVAFRDRVIARLRTNEWRLVAWDVVARVADIERARRAMPALSEKNS